ncbi:MAG: hypothetical protein AAGD25_21585 [Cyanobacteria bacterium P01_F01_bin.150]
MLPSVLMDGEFSLFHFWLDGDVQDGISYEGDIFCCLCTVDSEYRPQLYHYACHLMQKDSVVITVSDEHCSLWISLRSPNLGHLKSQCIDEERISEFLELSID